MSRAQSDSNEQQGIFVRKPIDFRPKGQITHLCASNGEMLLVIGGRELLHISLRNLSRQIEIVLPLSTHDRIAYVHMHVGGRHAIISSSGGENFYVSLKNDLPKPLKRLKGSVISAVGWNLELCTDLETSFIVLGTTKGSLAEVSIQSTGNIIYLKELTPSLTGEKDLPITNVELHQCEEDGDKQRWALLVCVPGRLYSLTGVVNPRIDYASTQPVMGTIWSSAFAEIPAAVLQPLFAFKEAPRFHCMDDKQQGLPSSFVSHPNSGGGEMPNKFCWLGEHGYTMGRLDLLLDNGYAIVEEDAHLQHKMVNGRYNFPLDIALTEYHVILLYSDRLEAVSLLNQKCMFEDSLGLDSGQVKGMCRDAVSEMIWVFTDSGIWRYRPDEETRHIWRIYLDRGEFGKARAVTSRLRDKAPHQLVIKKEADKYIADKNYVAAAELLAESTDPFEVTVLKFLSTVDDRRNGLKRFLDLQLNKLNSPEDKIRRDALVLWLLEVQLTEMAELRRAEGRRLPEENVLSPGALSSSEVRFRTVRQQLELFFARPIVLSTIESNREAVYRLLTSHADFDNQLYLAQKLRDYDTVINIHLLKTDFKKALEVIRSQHVPAFYYKYSPLLIERIPSELVFAWMEEEKENHLSTELLLPALYRCQRQQNMVTAALEYLNFVIDKGSASKSVHNFMISLCARYKPSDLFIYFQKFGFDKNKVPYDVEFALRICLEKKELQSSSVHLYCVDGLYDEAVSLALTFDVDLAKECAKRMADTVDENDFLQLEPVPKYPLEMRRRIWLQIARYVIEKQQDAAACMNLLKDSKDVIKIQDLLPFFPEFTTIEHFKDPLCACLKEHSGKIKELQRQMKEATEVSHEIRKDMDKLKSKFTVIRANDQCSLCGELAMSRPFYAFNCRHLFHRECLEKEVKGTWTEEDHGHYTKLLEKEKLLQKQLDEFDKKPGQTPRKRKGCSDELANLRTTLGDLVAGNCVLCGPIMIESIDKPFFTAEEYEKELALW